MTKAVCDVGACKVGDSGGVGGWDDDEHEQVTCQGKVRNGILSTE